MEVTAERDDLLLRLYDHAVFEEGLEHKLKEKDNILPANMAFVKHLKNNISLSETGKKLEEQINKRWRTT